MNDVQFDEQGSSVAPGAQRRPSGIIAFAIALGLGKDAASAQRTLVLAALAAIVLAALIFASGKPEVLPAPEPSLTFLS